MVSRQALFSDFRYDNSSLVKEKKTVKRWWREYCSYTHVLGPKLFFVTGLVIFVSAVARLVCPDLLG